jgi:zona occludens toxin
MITFHEGLPRSGKSYEAMIAHILPNVKKGRKVFAYIEGINHAKIAELTEKPLEEVQRLVTQINREDVENIYSVVDNDSFVIIDELQNFFPSGRQKLSDEMTQFVTEHGHRGLDILAMGQSLADCHNLWKRRTEVKMTFTKLSAVGKSNSYKWEAYRGHLKSDGNVKYAKLRSGIKKYDPKYFGSYASHTAETDNTSDYVDDRTNIFKSPTFKYGLPIVLAIGIYAINHLIGFFNGEGVAEEPSKVQAQTVTNQSISRTANYSPPVIIQKAYVDYFDETIQKNRARLAGVIDYGKYQLGLIEVLDNTFHSVERFDTDELKELGWKMNFTKFGLIISKKGVEHLIRSFPIDGFGTVNDAVTPELSQ